MTPGTPKPQQPLPIRRGQESAVHSLIDRCYREYGLSLNLADPCEHHLADPGAYFRSRGGEFWVVPDESGLIRATVALHIRAATLGGANLAELKSLYVDPAWRRQGWGRRLSLMVMDAARAAPSREMELWSDTRFTAAHSLYESLGFIRFSRRDIEASNQSSEWGYRRAL